MKYFLIMTLTCSFAFAAPTKDKSKKQIKQEQMLSPKQIEALEKLVDQAESYINSMIPSCPDFSRIQNMECA